MSKRISWPREQRKQAKASGKTLVAVGFSGPHMGMQFYGPCDETTAWSIFWVSHYLSFGNTLDESLALTKEAAADRAEQQAKGKTPGA